MKKYLALLFLASFSVLAALEGPGDPDDADDPNNPTDLPYCSSGQLKDGCCWDAEKKMKQCTSPQCPTFPYCGDGAVDGQRSLADYI